MNNPDNYILAAAYYLKKQQENVIMVTNDRFLRLKAEASEVEVVSGYDRLVKAVEEISKRKPVTSRPADSSCIEKNKEEKPRSVVGKPIHSGGNVADIVYL